MRQLNWYFSVSALIYDVTKKNMTPPMIHICHKQIALLSGWPFFLRGLFVAIIGEIHWNKLFFGCNTLYLFFFFWLFLQKGTFQLDVESPNLLWSLLFLYLKNFVVLWRKVCDKNNFFFNMIIIKLFWLFNYYYF